MWVQEFGTDEEFFEQEATEVTEKAADFAILCCLRYLLFETFRLSAGTLALSHDRPKTSVANPPILDFVSTRVETRSGVGSGIWKIEIGRFFPSESHLRDRDAWAE